MAKLSERAIGAMDAAVYAVGEIARLRAINAELVAWCESQTREDGHWIECPCPPGYDHKYMPHSEAVRICTQLRAALAKVRQEQP